LLRAAFFRNMTAFSESPSRFAFVRERPNRIPTMHHLHTRCQSLRKIRMLALLGLSAGLLGGCETNGGPSNPLSELAAYSSGANASAPARQEVKPPEKPITKAQAASDCWAMAEKSRSSASLEARADFVYDCIDKKLGVAAKPNAKPAATPKPRQRAEAKPAS
jgi:hypothetical protein